MKAIVGDEIKMLMAERGGGGPRLVRADAAEIMWENEKLDYVVPQEGSNLWFDLTGHSEDGAIHRGAHAFINFMLDPEAAAQNAEYVGYSTPNAAAHGHLPEEIAATSGSIRRWRCASLEVYENLGPDWTGKYSEFFLEFKMAL